MCRVADFSSHFNSASTRRHYEDAELSAAVRLLAKSIDEAGSGTDNG